MFQKMSSHKIKLTICLLLTFAVLAAFWQVKNCDFINYDDKDYVTENSHIKNGITTEAIRWAFTTTHTGYWHPLTWLSYMLDYELFRLNPAGYHTVNLLFHIVNSLLLFLVFLRMTKAVWQSAFIAAVFALHPLHVESVAWVAERKDVLSTFFWTLTMGTYVFYVEKGELKKYFLTLFFFVMGLMAKPMLVTLPFVLLLLDYWPLRRFPIGKSSVDVHPQSGKSLNVYSKKKGRGGNTKKAWHLDETEKQTRQWLSIGHIVLEKVPFFALSLASSVITYIAQQKEGAMKSFEAFPLSARIGNAFISYVVYIGKMVWPKNLAIFYPYPESIPNWQIIGAVALLISVTLIVAWAAKRLPYLATGWLWYVGTLVPVIGFVQVGDQVRADRYTYVPLIGLLVMAAWGIPELLKRWRYKRDVLFASSAIVLVSFLIATWMQVGHWQSSISVFSHALEVTSRNCIAHYNRGNEYLRLGNYAQAVEDYNKAIEINPRQAEIYYNRGLAHDKRGSVEQAIADYDKTIEINHRHVKAFNNRGIAYSRLDNYRQAIADFSRAIELDPEYGEAYYNRGINYGRLRNFKQAIADFDRAIGLNPMYREAYYNRAASHYILGNQRQAFEDLKIAAKFGDEDAKNFLRSERMSW